MHSKSKKLGSAEIAAFEAKRDIGAEILQSIKDMKADKGKVIVSSATQAREATGLSQSQFASLLGVPFARSRAGNRDVSSPAARLAHCLPLLARIQAQCWQFQRSSRRRPPVTLVPGSMPIQDVKCLTVGERDISALNCETTASAVVTSTPSMRVRSTYLYR